MPPRVQIETVGNPLHYTAGQIERAQRLAELLKRGRLVLCEEPGRCR